MQDKIKSTAGEPKGEPFDFWRTPAVIAENPFANA